MKKYRYLVASGILLLLVSFPYLLAALSGGKGFVFSGFLLNPIDGNSYLAKMYEGWSGSWAFTLPYTLERSSHGAFLFFFYLLLGQASRLIRLPLILTFHLARILGSCFFLVTFAWFCNTIFSDTERAWRAFLFGVFGSGLGWLFFFSGTLTSDFWVAEAYPFLSMYANPHFPIGLALLLLAFILALRKPTRKIFWIQGAMGIVLAIIMPFGVIVVGTILAIYLLWEWIERRYFDWRKLAPFAFFGGPVVLYQYVITLQDPLLSAWNRQNLTPAPALLDFLAALSPVLIFCVIAIWYGWKHPDDQTRLLIAWALGSILLIYLPFNLQRRFMFGIFIPVEMLGITGIYQLSIRIRRISAGQLSKVILALSIPTNLLLLLAGLVGSQGHDLSIYLTNHEYEVMQWISVNTPRDAHILASPDSGLLIPAYTGRRVVYGHPFETADATKNQEFTKSFFGTESTIQQDKMIQEKNIQFIFVGPREKKLGTPMNLNRFPIAIQSEDVTLYKTALP
jgi:hypothetical protein